MSRAPQHTGPPPEDCLVLCNLASGSRGNVTYVGRGDRALLVDVGLSARKTAEKLVQRGLDPSRVAGIVLTHEHGDHTRGARVFARRHRVPIYVQREARARIPLDGVRDVRTFDGDRPFEVAGFEVHPFSIPHDTVEPVAFVIDDGERKVGVATDMGMTTHLTVEKLRACQAVVLEFNHDLKMLMEGPYPWWLKQRVRGRLGHLDNTEALGVLERIVDGGVQVALLGHLSQENNDPSLVRALALDCLARNGQEHVQLTVLEQDDPGPVVRVLSDATVELGEVGEDSR